MRISTLLTAAAAGLLLIGAAGCDYLVEGFQDGAEDFVAEITRKLLEMLTTPHSY